MQRDDLEARLRKVLQRPDLLVMSEGLQIDCDPHLKMALSLRHTDHGAILHLGGSSPRFDTLSPTLIRYGIELFYLIEAGIPPMLASFASARIAAQFHLLDVADACPLPLFLSPFASAHPDKDALLHRIADLCAFLPDKALPSATERHDAVQTVMALWSLLAPTETLMGGGGDSRLAVDTKTGLNRYACSHRPRPWAVSFGSSTASSLSERGFGGAEKARRAMMIALLSNHNAHDVQHHCLVSVRERIGRHIGLPVDQVIVNASGTDCELAALSLVAIRTSRPISTLLIAPDETGSGVPLAAQGRHFASDSACTDHVHKGEQINGFPHDITLIPIAIRTEDGKSRTREEIDQECRQIALQEAEKGRHVLLHRLDQSKTGMVAPSIHIVDELMEQLGEHITVVVDACQARVSPSRMTQWVQRGMMVMLTGSKFFTGPPFCGALLVPSFLIDQLRHTSLPTGLRHYSHRSEWPDHADESALSEGYNLGLAFRWEAALAEMDALFAHSNETIRARLDHFMDYVKQALDHIPQIDLIPPPSLGNDPLWDGIPTILSFLVRDPTTPNHPLSLEDARRLHRWLNADLSPWISEPDEEPSLFCVLGQPVPVAHSALRSPAGALRFCAGARLVSGEPSHSHLNSTQRMARECRDVQRVLKKLQLILRHWTTLLEADPIPRYAPLSQP